jgi:hypothetical protein
MTKKFNHCEICEDPELCGAGKTVCDLTSEFESDVPREVANKLLQEARNSKVEYTGTGDFTAAVKWVENLIFQRQCGAVGSLDLRDCRAIRTVLKAFQFQSRVNDWMKACFTPEIIADKLERSDRFIEESLELVQSCGYSADRAHARWWIMCSTDHWASPSKKSVVCWSRWQPCAPRTIYR